MNDRSWTNEAQLAALLRRKADAGQETRLTPHTAGFIAAKLEMIAEKPTRDGVAMAMCSAKCLTPCISCIGRANQVVRVYGFSLE